MNKVSAKADVFSFGCVCFVFLTREKGGIHPFGDWNTPHLSAQVQCNIREGKQVNIAGYSSSYSTYTSSAVAVLDTEILWFIPELKHVPFANIILPMIENNPDNRGSLKEFMKKTTILPASSSIPSNKNTNTQQEQTLADLFLVIKQKHEIDMYVTYYLLRLRSNLIPLLNLTRRC